MIILSIDQKLTEFKIPVIFLLHLVCHSMFLDVEMANVLLNKSLPGCI